MERVQTNIEDLPEEVLWMVMEEAENYSDMALVNIRWDSIVCDRVKFTTNSFFTESRSNNDYLQLLLSPRTYQSLSVCYNVLDEIQRKRLVHYIKFNLDCINEAKFINERRASIDQVLKQLELFSTFKKLNISSVNFLRKAPQFSHVIEFNNLEEFNMSIKSGWDLEIFPYLKAPLLKTFVMESKNLVYYDIKKILKFVNLSENLEKVWIDQDFQYSEADKSLKVYFLKGMFDELTAFLDMYGKNIENLSVHWTLDSEMIRLLLNKCNLVNINIDHDFVVNLDATLIVPSVKKIECQRFALTEEYSRKLMAVFPNAQEIQTSGFLL
jgi:hypothetical protein